jgi:DNA topoisomerase-1
MTHIERLQRQGILRKGSPRSGFRYVYASTGRPARGQLQRIRALRVPPAWRDVAINPSARGRLQAIGRDAAGRGSTCTMPPTWRVREQRLSGAIPGEPAAVGAPSPATCVRRCLRERVLATIVRIRLRLHPAGQRGLRGERSSGLATIPAARARRRRHGPLRFCRQERQPAVLVRDRGVAQVVRRLLTVPGYELFKFVNEQGGVVDVKRADINDYIKSHMGDAFSAKDFRTWSATLICACTLAQAPADDANARARKKEVVAAIKATAAQLGNTPAICRSSYISPGVLSAYEGGRVVDRCFRSVEDLIARRRRGLHPSEKALLRLLQRK